MIGLNLMGYFRGVDAPAKQGEDVRYTLLEEGVFDAVDDRVHATAHEDQDHREIVEVAREVAIRVAEIVHQIVYLHIDKTF